MGNYLIQLNVRPSPKLPIASLPVLSREKLAQRRHVLYQGALCAVLYLPQVQPGCWEAPLPANPISSALTFSPPTQPVTTAWLTELLLPMQPAPLDAVKAGRVLLGWSGLASEASFILAAATLLGVDPRLSPPHPRRDLDGAELHDSDVSA